MPSPPDPPQVTRERVRRAVEREVAQVDSPAAAEAVVEKVERLAAGVTEQQKGEAAAGDAANAAAAVERATQAPSPADEAAAVLTRAAAEAVAPTPEAAAVLAGAREALSPAPETPSPAGAPAPAVKEGHWLLKEAVLRQMGPLQKLDARIFLAINGFPHPPWSDRLANSLTVWTTGGWIWAGAVLAARLLRVPCSGRALAQLLPSMIGATWVVEYPVKSFFRRRRPFIDIVRALVVGKKPGSWSFPSGHTASSFACACVLSTVWPRAAPAFFALAAGVGLSRVYVGAHYPGDVASGAMFGVALSEVIRRVTCRAARRRWPWVCAA